jgi:coenzyme F420-reducing hydrogenase alpha subunit
MKVNTRLDYIARVEGEGAVKLEFEGGTLKDLKLNIWEPPRFFEGFLAGRKFDEVPDIVARICGICPVSHMMTSIRAIENASGFMPSGEINKMRNVMSLSQTASSHVVHLYVLALPDYKKLDMISLDLQKEVARLLRMKEVLNNLTALFGGRPCHPVAMVVGGFTKAPSRDEIGNAVKNLETIKQDAMETLKMIADLKYPDFEGDTEFVAVTGRDEYVFNGGIIESSMGINAHEHEYPSYFYESELPYSNAKRTIVKERGSLMVGALARFNLKHETLHPEAKKAAQSIGFSPPDRNPFHNNIAQAIEIIHCIFKCVEILEVLNVMEPLMEIKVREGSGFAVTEAPRECSIITMK